MFTSCCSKKVPPPPEPLPEPALTYEDVLKWKRSFECVLETQQGRELFLKFLKYEYTEEHLLFCMAVDELKSETNPEKIEEKCRIIQDDYIVALAPMEVTIDGSTRDLITLKMASPDKNVFDKAQKEVFDRIHRDSWPRFIQHEYYCQFLSSLVISEQPGRQEPKRINPLFS